ncbi:ATP-grasp domain-containing protein [Halomonas sp. HK25]|uniref:carboxylate--amine ligase n=1 Tax=Halomonas sp. HK25 TaxID=3394321 RepID=UPI0039FDA4CB
MKRMADVLLTYGWCRSSYSALRGLAQQGLKVVVTDTGRIGMCQASRLAYARARYRSPFADPQGFVADIDTLCRDYDITMILAGHEEVELLALAREQGRLTAPAALPVARAATIEMANDKYRMACLAREQGVSVAAIMECRCPEDAMTMSDPANEYVARARRGNSSKGVFFARGGAPLMKTLDAMRKTFDLEEGRPPIVQERVAGDGWGVSCLYWHGQPIASFTHRRLEEKLATGGTSTLRISAAHPAIEADAHRLLRALGWHGLAMLEFKHDEASGRHFFIEINPRLWGSIDLALSSGVNFPWLLYLAQTQGPAVALAHFHPARQGVVERWLLGDVIRRLGLASNGAWRQALAFQGVSANAFDDAKRDDPLVLVGEAFYYLSKAIRSRSMNPLEAGMVR